jgi:hypothetical protein
MDLLNKYPKVKQQFLGYMIESYGCTEQIFDNAPYLEQCRAICRYLGYSLDIEDVKDLDSHIDNILYLYDSLIGKIIVDPLKLIKTMDYQEREHQFKFNIPEKILLSIANSLILISESNNVSSMTFISLKDALITFLKPKQENNKEQIVWENIINESIKHEIAPF